MGFFRQLQLERVSFWAGFLAATLFWWLLSILSPLIRRLWQTIREGVKSTRQSWQAGIEHRFREDILKHVQNLHLASSLFSLDEILIPPRLIAPPPLAFPDETPPSEDIVRLTIPYTPDWPELASCYGAHTLTPFQALEGGMNLAIIGHAGCGKTIALAYMASQLARQDPCAGEFQHFLPCYIHIHDLNFVEKSTEKPLDQIVSALRAKVSNRTLPKLAEVIRARFEEGTVLLLLDGLDELALEPYRKALEFLQNLLDAYPSTRLVVATAVNHFEGLPQLGLVPIPMATWGQHDQMLFLEKWSTFWEQYIEPNDVHPENTVDPLLLNSWILHLNPAATPLEFTLNVWAAYAGDTRGPKEIDVLDAYIQRMSAGLSEAREVLSQIGIHVLITQKTAFTPDGIRKGIPKERLPEEVALPEGKEMVPRGPVHQLIHELIQRGLLIPTAQGEVMLANPLLAGYLAGLGLSSEEEEMLSTQPAWALLEMATAIRASQQDMDDRVRHTLANTDDPLLQGVLSAGRWLRNTEPNASWRVEVLKHLTSVLQADSLPLGLRSSSLAALASSGDGEIPALFRHLLTAPQATTRGLAALGCGYLRETAAIPHLVKLLSDDIFVVRATCLALVNIGTKTALEAVASALLEGDEETRRAAAEAFANHPTEGHEVLRDGSTVDDLLVRRAVIFGLRRIRQDWSKEILFKMQIEDGQWIVKDAAGLALEELRLPDPSIPRPLPELENLPWLVTFASQHGLGISCENKALQMLNQAIQEGSEDEKLAALDVIRYRGETDVFPAVYHALYDPNPAVSQAAYLTLWHIKGLGVDIPHPTQFGLGKSQFI